MSPAARLQRLRKLMQDDVEALPDRDLTSEDDSEGGVFLEPPQLQSNAGKQPPVNGPALSGNVAVSTSQVPAKSQSESAMVASSCEPDLALSSIQEAPLATSPLPALSLHRGEFSSSLHQFTPIQALARYPYKYCNRNHMQDIASAFFDAGKFWERDWDLYYIWDIEPVKPLILVHASQVDTLLIEINSCLDLNLAITNQQREEGLVASFPDHPRCLPRYLGRSHTREEFNNMVDNAPSADFRTMDEKSHPVLQPPTIEEFKQLMGDLWDAQKAKTKANRAKKQQERLVKQKTMVEQFKRAQRYLGLRPSAEESASSGIPLMAIDPDCPVPYACDQSVVFVCVDVESYERSHDKITEVGIATLDTRDLLGLAPGSDGSEWRKQIHARHFRVNEHKHLRNGQFVSDNSDGFLFGESTFVALKDAAQHVASCFQTPFGAHHSDGAQDMMELMGGTDAMEKRNIIFLGHDTLGDVKYLQQLGYDPMRVENIIEALDTAVMYRVWRREQQATKLGKILSDFDIVGWRLHNAGNDAVYTIQAMLAICVREATIRGSSKMNEFREEQKAVRAAAAFEDTQRRLEEDKEGWSDNEAEGNGGVPVPWTAFTSGGKVPNAAHLGTRSHNDGTARQVMGSAMCQSNEGHDDTGHGSVQGQSRPRGRGRGAGRHLGRDSGMSVGEGMPEFEAAQADNGMKFNW